MNLFHSNNCILIPFFNSGTKLDFSQINSGVCQGTAMWLYWLEKY